MDRSRTVIVGAGPAGLAAAAMLGREGIHAVVLERAPHVAASWRTHYDRLRLHTTRSLSDLPDYRLPWRYGRWVPRDGVVTYLEEYATYHCLEIQFGTNVERIDRGAGHWRLETSRGAVEAPCVVVATGYNHSPFLPHWPGCERFAGELVHSSAYRNARPYRGRDVLVVGAGNSGAEIAVDLVEGGARQVWLSIRTPPQIVPRQALGIPAQLVGVAIRRMPLPLADWIVALLQKLFVGDLSSYGLPRPSTGLYSQFLRTDVIPIIDVGLIEALKRRQVQVVSAVERFHNGEVLLRDGNRNRTGDCRRRHRLPQGPQAARWSPRRPWAERATRRTRTQGASAGTGPVLHRLHEPHQRHPSRDRDRGTQDRARRCKGQHSQLICISRFLHRRESPVGRAVLQTIEGRSGHARARPSRDRCQCGSAAARSRCER